MEPASVPGSPSQRAETAPLITWLSIHAPVSHAPPGSHGGGLSAPKDTQLPPWPYPGLILCSPRPPNPPQAPPGAGCAHGWGLCPQRHAPQRRRRLLPDRHGVRRRQPAGRDPPAQALARTLRTAQLGLLPSSGRTRCDPGASDISACRAGPTWAARACTSGRARCWQSWPRRGFQGSPLPCCAAPCRYSVACAWTSAPPAVAAQGRVCLAVTVHACWRSHMPAHPAQCVAQLPPLAAPDCRLGATCLLRAWSSPPLTASSRAWGPGGPSPPPGATGCGCCMQRVLMAACYVLPHAWHPRPTWYSPPSNVASMRSEDLALGRLMPPGPTSTLSHCLLLDPSPAPPRFCAAARTLPWGARHLLRSCGRRAPSSRPPRPAAW